MESLPLADEIVGNDLDIGEHRHEVRIPVPPRHGMDMKMVGHTRTGATAEIRTDVASVRTHHMIDDTQRCLNDPDELVSLVRTERGEISMMLLRSYQ